MNQQAIEAANEELCRVLFAEEDLPRLGAEARAILSLSAAKIVEAALPALEADIRSQISAAIVREVEEDNELGEWDESFSNGMVYAADIVEGNL